MNFSEALTPIASAIHEWRIQYYNSMYEEWYNEMYMELPINLNDESQESFESRMLLNIIDKLWAYGYIETIDFYNMSNYTTLNTFDTSFNTYSNTWRNMFGTSNIIWNQEEIFFIAWAWEIFISSNNEVSYSSIQSIEYNNDIITFTHGAIVA